MANNQERMWNDPEQFQQNNDSSSQTNINGDGGAEALIPLFRANFVSSIDVLSAEQKQIAQYLVHRQSEIMTTISQILADFQRASNSGNEALKNEADNRLLEANAQMRVVNRMSQELDQMFAAHGAEIKKNFETFDEMMRTFEAEVKEKNQRLLEDVQIMNQQSATINSYMELLGMRTGMRYAMPVGVSQPAGLGMIHPIPSWIPQPAIPNQQPSGLHQTPEGAPREGNSRLRQQDNSMFQQQDPEFFLDPSLRGA